MLSVLAGAANLAWSRLLTLLASLVFTAANIDPNLLRINKKEHYDGEKFSTWNENYALSKIRRNAHTHVYNNKALSRGKRECP
jgi:hypothetical protein